jgi:hypothetical protein
MNLQKFINGLPVNSDGVKPKAWICNDAKIPYVVISAESGDCIADYFGEYNGFPWIAEYLVAYAVANKGYFEWVNAGCFAFNEN